MKTCYICKGTVELSLVDVEVREFLIDRLRSTQGIEGVAED